MALATDKAMTFLDCGVGFLVTAYNTISKESYKWLIRACGDIGPCCGTIGRFQEVLGPSSVSTIILSISGDSASLSSNIGSICTKYCAL